MCIFPFLGGTNSWGGTRAEHKNTTEYYKTDTDTFEEGPLLPYEYGLIQHCLAWKDDDVIMMVGGVIKSTSAGVGFTTVSDVFEFNTRDETFTKITDTAQNQKSPGCLVLDTASNGKELIVAGGNFSDT